MPAYLLTWNPLKFDWSNLSELAKKIDQGKPYKDSWSVVNKHVRAGDRLFLYKQGTDPRGLFGSAFAGCDPYVAKHWSGNGKPTRYITLKYDKLLDVSKHPDLILPRARLLTGAVGTIHWATQGSGIRISDKAAEELERIWADHLRTLGAGARPFTSAAESVGLELAEGELLTPRLVAHRRREQLLRSEKIRTVLEKTGVLQCEISGCAFDFFRTYGELGKNYAHVHHLSPLAESDGKSKTSLNDLAIVCANCHAMIHRSGECLAPKQIERALATPAR